VAVAATIDESMLGAADRALDSDEHTSEAVKEATGGLGASAVFDFVGIDATLQLAASVIRKRGKITIVGLGVASPARIFAGGWGGRSARRGEPWRQVRPAEEDPVPRLSSAPGQGLAALPAAPAPAAIFFRAMRSTFPVAFSGILSRTITSSGAL